MVGCVLGMFPLLLIDYEGAEQKRRLAEVFKVIDKDKTGKINVQELSVALERFGLAVSPSPPSPPSWPSLSNVADRARFRVTWWTS
jgi:hypothetical protein